MPYADAEDARERWDAVAETYASKVGKLGDGGKEVLLTPTLLDLAGDVAGKRVLEAGCGEGFLSRLLAERGAAVHAIDYSQSMIEIARKKEDTGPTGQVKVNAIPWAKVYLGRKKLGTTPCRVKVPVGPQTLVLKKGDVRKTVRVNVKEGQLVSAPLVRME